MPKPMTYDEREAPILTAVVEHFRSQLEDDLSGPVNATSLGRVPIASWSRTTTDLMVHMYCMGVLDQRLAIPPDEAAGEAQRVLLRLAATATEMYREGLEDRESEGDEGLRALLARLDRVPG